MKSNISGRIVLVIALCMIYIKKGDLVKTRQYIGGIFCKISKYILILHILVVTVLGRKKGIETVE